MTDVQTIGDALRKTAPRYPICTAALIGSYARGEEHAHSDVDILIETDGAFSLLDAARFRRELSHSLGTDVDVVSKRALSESFARNVLNDQVILYERS